MKQELLNAIRKDCITSCTDIFKLEALKQQSILVTGGTGFMGKWIAEMVSYLNQEHRFNINLYILARNIDDFKKNAPHLAALSFIRFIEQDVRNVTELPEQVSWVIHAAASPDNREHSTQPLKIIDTIYNGTNTILDACLRLQTLNKLLYISSNTVYGKVDNDSHILSETDMGALNCNSVNAAYSEAKRLAETACAVYRNQQKLPVTIVRPFAFIGPYQGMEKPWAVNNFMRDSILGGPVRILGNENTVRSYLYGSDMAYWLLALLASPLTVGKTYNLGSSQAISLRKLAEKITSKFTNKLEILVRSSKDYSQVPNISVPDISNITNTIGVKQEIDLDTALTQTIQWYQKNHNSN